MASRSHKHRPTHWPTAQVEGQSLRQLYGFQSSIYSHDSTPTEAQKRGRPLRRRYKYSNSNDTHSLAPIAGPEDGRPQLQLCKLIEIVCGSRFHAST
eukprot:6171893-Prymnesium_polylepis.1